MSGAGERGQRPPAPLIWQQPPAPPRQRSLGREEIVRAAVAVADRDGAEGLTMAAVARHIGPYSPMALYRYVHSKDGLVDLMLDAVTAEIDLPDRPSGDWRDDLHTLAVRSWQVVRRHPWFPRLAHSRPPAGPHMMRRIEFALAVLVAEGVPVADAMTYTALVDRHVLGSGLQEAEERRMDERYGLGGAAGPEQLLAALAPMRDLAAAGPYPHLAAWLAAPAGPDADGQFALGLRFLLDGIGARLPRARGRAGA